MLFVRFGEVLEEFTRDSQKVSFLKPLIVKREKVNCNSSEHECGLKRYANCCHGRLHVPDLRKERDGGEPRSCQ